MINKESPLSIGILGLGKHATQVMLPAIDESKSVIHGGLGSEFHQRTHHSPSLAKYSAQTPLYSYQGLLTDPDIEALYIALPNHLHVKWTIKALEAGKHVLCEKPLALLPSEAREIASLAKSNKLHVREAFMYRHHPQHALAQDSIRAGEIGELCLLEAHFHYNLEDLNNIRHRKECAGGALNDVGCYGADVARWYFGTLPKQVSGTWALNPKTGVDERGFYQLDFGNGRAAHISCGSRLGRENSLTLYGTKGRLALESAFRVPRNKKPLVELKNSEGKTNTLSTQAANQFVRQLDSFAELIRNDRNQPSLSETYNEDNAVLLDAMSMAAKDSIAVRLGT